jgi:hypothetical protein
MASAMRASGDCYKRGHRYLTVVIDHDRGRLVWAAPGRPGGVVELDVLHDRLLCLSRRHQRCRSRPNLLRPGRAPCLPLAAQPRTRANDGTVPGWRRTRKGTANQRPRCTRAASAEPKRPGRPRQSNWPRAFSSPPRPDVDFAQVSGHFVTGNGGLASTSSTNLDCGVGRPAGFSAKRVPAGLLLKWRRKGVRPPGLTPAPRASASGATGGGWQSTSAEKYGNFWLFCAVCPL